MWVSVGEVAGYSMLVIVWGKVCGCRVDRGG